MQPIVKMKEIRKLFPGVIALDSINFDLYPSEVHVLIGENGAGKSTLMKILSGAYSPTGGTIEINGRACSSLTPPESIAQGIGIIYQELSVIDQLSIGENVFLGRQPMKKTGFLSMIDEKTMHAEAAGFLKKVGLTVNTRLPLYTLSLAEKQLVEIAKVLSQNARVIIMDEPTSSLNSEEVELLFQTIRALKAEGVAIVYISHKIKELRAIGDRITVLKDGKTIATKKISEFVSDDQISSLMVGREMRSERYNLTDSRIEDDVILKLEDFSRRDGKTKKVSIELHPGEIIGFAGLVGAGRTELMEAIFGAAGSRVTGQVSLNGKLISNDSTYKAIRNDLGMITENRRATGFMNNFSIRENIAVPRGLKTARLGGIFGLIDHAQEKSVAAGYKDLMKVKATSIEQKVETLSGGNQQKVIIAKWLAAGSRVLIFDEPTRGIDVGSKQEIYQLMRKLANEGKGILMVSSELPELINVCDRIIVYGDGQILKEFKAEDVTEEKIMAIVTGGN